MEHTKSPAGKRVGAIAVCSVSGDRWLVIDASHGPTGIFYKEIFGPCDSGEWELLDCFAVEDQDRALPWSRKFEDAQCVSVPVPDLGPTQAPANIARFAEPRRVAAKGAPHAEYGRKVFRLPLRR